MDSLAAERAVFRAQMEAAHAPDAWAMFRGRIGVVLAGGGGRGAYEAGVLLAFQDAHVPTHLITGASIGGINAASYAAHSRGYVGNAEPLLRAWTRLSPLAVGIDWTRYVWKVVGLIVASAGVGNFVESLLELQGAHFTLKNPLLTWAFLAIIGLTLLYFYEAVPYFGYVLRHSFKSSRRHNKFRVDFRKAMRSLAANVLLWGSTGGLLVSLGALTFLRELMHPIVATSALLAVGASIALRVFFPRFMEMWLHKFFRLPFRRGLFNNFNRTRLMRRLISEKKLRTSPIRVVFPATDLHFGHAIFFSNAPPEDLAKDAGIDPSFPGEVSDPGDMILALVATSALPLAFEPIRLRGRVLTDGGLVSTQPIRPAVRLGADVLFLVTMEPIGAKNTNVRTFVDMGLRALNILVVQNLVTDRKTLESVNAICETAAKSLGLRPEAVELDMGTRRYRYIKHFTISPSLPLEATILEFGGRTSSSAILQGYREAALQIAEFLQYSKTAHYGAPKRLLRLQALPE